jgi:hypothetical protein
MIQDLVIEMEEARLHTLAQVMASPDGAVEGAFQVPKVGRHRGIERVRTRFGAVCQGRADKGPLFQERCRAG